VLRTTNAPVDVRPPTGRQSPSGRNSPANPASEAPDVIETEPPKLVAIDFSKYRQLEKLGDGEAKQKLRKFDDDLQVAQRTPGRRARLSKDPSLFDKGLSQDRFTTG